MIQTVILAGGSGTRLKEMTEMTPKGLIPIGGVPMVTHIMRHYASYGFKDFVLALGYKQEAFKMYFSHYDLINNDTTVNIGRWAGSPPQITPDRWRVILSDTGPNTLKGGRLKRIEKYIQGTSFFCSYGDGLADINLKKLLAFHETHGKIVTMTAVRPPAKFGEICQGTDNRVVSFKEKPLDGSRLISGGFFVFNRGIFDYLTADGDLEVGPLELLAEKGEVMAYHHPGWFGCMDTLHDMQNLQELWDSGEIPWRGEYNV